MSNTIKKLFGGLELTWPRLIIAAIVAGIVTGLIALIPALHYTSFIAITVTFEVWILFGIIIIMNSKSNLDSALKCFVFFLISQPLVYLVQVPFNDLGWQLFGYYKYWFIWTVLCLPMGFIGYYMKKDKWWGYFILLPMILLTASSYRTYLFDFQFYMPKYILICLFCAAAMIIYPIAIFTDKKIKTVGALIGVALVIALTVIGIMKPPIYSTEIMGSSEEYAFDDTYKVSLADEEYGDVEVIYIESIENYMVHAEFKKAGETVLIMESHDGEKKEYNLIIEKDTVKSEMLNCYKKFMNESDTVRVTILPSIVQLSKIFQEPELQKLHIQNINSASIDKSWRVRNELANLYPQFIDYFQNNPNLDLVQPICTLMKDSETEVKASALKASGVLYTQGIK